MIVFVSYARRDNDLDGLTEIAGQVAHLGCPYIDDARHHDEDADRTAVVEEALRTAAAFVAVRTPHYLRTPWTRWEYLTAQRSGIPMYELVPGQRLVRLQPPNVRTPRLLHDTLADTLADTHRTANATIVLTSASKAVTRVVLATGVVVLALVALVFVLGQVMSVGPVVATLLATGGAGATYALARRR